MVYFNLRHIFFTIMFILGMATLFIGYGAVGLFWTESQGNKVEYAANIKDVSGLQKTAGTEKGQPAANSKEEFFVEYRLQRERTRGQQIELLKDVVNSPASAEDTRKSAQEQLLGISKGITREANVENLLKARGYKDAVVCVDPRSVTVVVDSRALSSAEETKIMELVSKETGFGEQGIILIPKL
ncbi:MAG: SpoIIIAH-like family protein [Desulfocucumaceae bacterium]